MQSVLTGMPRSGKTSFLKRLLGLIPAALLASTDITDIEGSVRVDFREVTSFLLDIPKSSENISNIVWRKIEAQEEMEGFVSLITQQGGDPFLLQRVQDVFSLSATAGASGEHSSIEDIPSHKTTQEDQPITQHSQPTQIQSTQEKQDQIVPVESSSADMESESTQEISSHVEVEADKDSSKSETDLEDKLPKPSEVLMKALITMKQTELSNKIDSASFVRCTDTGGQPEYQELLSLLLTDANTVFIVFSLEHDLSSPHLLEYVPSVYGPPVTYESAYTVGEMMQQSLASVPVEESSETASQDVSGEKEFSSHSHVFFIATHKDKVSSERIEAVNRELMELIKHTPQHKANIVQRCSADSIVFPVNNLSSLEDDGDFAPIRRTTQELVYGSGSGVKAPTSWLFTGVVLQNMSESRPIISLDQCREIAGQCGVQQDSFKACLKFLHNKVGVLRYYETEHLRDVVFIKPQLLINALSHLMRRAFLKPLSSRAVVDEEDMSDVVTHFKWMARDRLIEIGLDLLVLCRHPNSTILHPLYYLTCMLPVSKEAVGERDDCVYFMTAGFVFPIGVGRATITGIVQQRMKTKTPWTVDYDTFYRNSLEFTVGSPATSFKISCSTKNLCLRVKNAGRSSREICSDVRIAIESVMTKVLTLYRYGQTRAPFVAFQCPSCDSSTTESHYATLVSEDVLKCSHTKNTFSVPSNLRLWVLVSLT